MQESYIEWTDATWNPVRGCSEVSPGCGHCYAKRFSERFRGTPGHAYEHGFDLRLVPEKLEEPLRWRTPQKIFVNSMSDYFHEDIPEQYILDIARVMTLANWHTYQILTKRSKRMHDILNTSLAEVGKQDHIWWGVSVENRKHGLPRIEHLQQSPVRMRFLSIEPLLENLGTIPLDGIDWVIVGGESGDRPRKMEADWVRSIRDQCREALVPFFFKQWGGKQKKKNGRRLDGRTYDRMPRQRKVFVPDKQQVQTFRQEIRERAQGWMECLKEVEDHRELHSLGILPKDHRYTENNASHRLPSIGTFH